MPYNMSKTVYKNLNKRQQEIYNYQEVSAILAHYGFECLHLNDDWNGADFIAIQFGSQNVFRVQLKGRWGIDKKYLGKDLFLIFKSPNNKKGMQWFFIKHDDLFAIIKQFFPQYLQTNAWINTGIYHANKLSKKLAKLLLQYSIE